MKSLFSPSVQQDLQALTERSYILERDGTIVTHARLWPLTFGMGESAVRGIRMIDWAFPRGSHVEPGQQFHAILKINGAIQRNAANLEPVRMGVLKAPGTSDS